MKKSWRPLLICLSLGGFYLLTHLPFLTRVPVFADESIYIRWAQLILDDWQRYFFFPLNDGKTPLFVWLMVPALKLVQDPLLAGRLLAVVFGLAQIWLTHKIVKRLGGRGLAALMAVLLTTLLPYWFTYHRMALMDGPLIAPLAAAWLLLINAIENKKNSIKTLIFSGLFFGLALLIKLPALLFLPTLVLTPLLIKPNKLSLKDRGWRVALPILFGIIVFASLKLHPAFGQLFRRGNDFLYGFQALMETGWLVVLKTNLRLTWETFNAYLTWPILILPFFGLFQAKWRRTQIGLILASLGFLLPILFLGKTVYPRYLLPAALPLTIGAALSFEAFFLKTQSLLKKPLAFIGRCVLLIFIITYTLSAATQWLIISWQNPDYLPYTLNDRVQYVLEWSSGHGILETTHLLQEAAKSKKIAVATEGFYGTLPDGILMYLHNQNVTNILVEGIGQPVRAIPDNFRAKAQNYDEVWLVVNRHREQMSLRQNPNAAMKWQFCRPTGHPCLEVWDITQLVKPAQ